MNTMVEISKIHDVLAEINEDHRDWRQSDEAVNETATQKNAGAVREITHRLREQRIDLTFPNVSGDLKVVLCWDDQVADQNREQIIINHRAVIVAVQSAATLLEHGRPEKHGAGERYQREQCAQEIIPAVHERVLEPDVKDGSVLGDLHGRETNQETRNRGNGISEIEGKGATGSAERVGKRASFKTGKED